MKPIFFEKISGLRDENSRQTNAVIPKKDYPDLRNRIVAGSVFAGLLLVVTSFTFGPVDDAPLADNKPQKKERRIKVVVNKDGKEMRIDTTFNLADEKMIDFKVDSMLEKLDVEGLVSDNADMINHRKRKTIFWNHKRGANLDDDEQIDVFFQKGDSGRMTVDKRIIHMGDGSDKILLGDGDSLFAPPPPPPPPMPPFPFEFNQRFNGGDPFEFDQDDSDIISYEKKDLGKGLEKITIIRKKQVGHNMKKEVKVKFDVNDDVKK